MCEGQVKLLLIVCLWFYFEDCFCVLLGSVFGVGCIIGFVGGIGVSVLNDFWLQVKVECQDVELVKVKCDVQIQVNVLVVCFGELQVQVICFNVFGEWLIQMGKLEDGEFDFNEIFGFGDGDVGGLISDILVKDVNVDLQVLEQCFVVLGCQLLVMELLMFDYQLQQNVVLLCMLICNSYVMFGFGICVDLFGRGVVIYKGMDFYVKVGDLVMVVVEGVVSFVGVKGGYGNVVDVDYGNGYVICYVYNLCLVVKVGDLVCVGQEVVKVGFIGCLIGVYVYFEVWENGNVVNLCKFFGDGGNMLVGWVSRG